jgi:hypothetical protein
VGMTETARKWHHVFLEGTLQGDACCMACQKGPG